MTTAHTQSVERLQLFAIHSITGWDTDGARRALDRIDAIQATEHPQVGRCRYCGCTEETACAVLAHHVRVTCEWWDDLHTICTNLNCIALAEAEQIASGA